MRTSQTYLFVAIVVGAGLIWPVRAPAETGTLQLKRLGAEVLDAGTAAFAVTIAQSFFHTWTSEDARPKDAQQPVEPPVISEGEARFKRIVKKEPAQYQSKHPLRAVAKLGSGEYAFVLDAKDAETRGYHRLYFDLNRNADLTDDKPIEATGRRSFGDFAQSTFPRADLKIEAGGAKFDYSFTMSVFCNYSKQFSYASASLSAAAYRIGQITIGGKKRNVALVDFNSNGRFDDEMKLEEDSPSFDGQIDVAPSDRLLVDPESSQRSSFDLVDVDNQRAVSKLVDIDGQFYRTTVTPAGDRLTLTPADLPTGELASPTESFRAVLIGREGCLVVRATKAAPARLPVGAWRLLSYRMEQTQPSEVRPTAKPEASAAKAQPETKAKPKRQQSPSLLGAVWAALFGTSRTPEILGPQPCSVTARATRKCKPLEIRAGQRLTPDVGPPFRPVVRAFPARDGKSQLLLSMVGAAGEVCTDLRIGGGRPPAPEFQILDPQGEVVQRGVFSYG